MLDIINTIYNTLSGLEIKSTKDNVARVYLCLENLDNLRKIAREMELPTENATNKE